MAPANSPLQRWGAHRDTTPSSPKTRTFSFGGRSTSLGMLFILWLVCPRKAKNKGQNLNNNEPFLPFYALYAIGELETHDHLFFRCHHSETVWETVNEACEV
ncbi:hypothetical protein OIU74_026432 [Salix koriyanagi]|uniref:Uncharacterized protein n=1 Tax=Salix koriyanagi TaxID=2511006 RepID=A0A9Q1A435_9ROSI|nr:hypothetical protein OIU74_026432 [Salix koriyanagi]